MSTAVLRNLQIALLVTGLIFQCQFLLSQPIEQNSASDNSISIFLIDGLSNEVFKELLRLGQLPTIDSLIKNGLYVENGISSFPSMTGYGFYPFITGIDAAESGIAGLRWFDRRLKVGNLRNYVGRSNVYLNEDLRKDVKTLYEYFPNQYTASINTYCNRGVTENINTGWALTTSKYGNDDLFGSLRKIPIIGKRISKNNFQHENLVLEKSLQQLKNNPKIHWITFPAPDGIIHVNGMTKSYAATIVYIDGLISQYISSANALDKNRIFAVISDHGIRTVQKNIKVEDELYKSTGLKIHRGKSLMLWKMTLDEPIKSLSEFDGQLVINGNLSAYLYMKNKNWAKNNLASELLNYHVGAKEIDLPAALVNIEGINFVCFAKDFNTVQIVNAQGHAFIESKNDSLKYIGISSDPLHYLDSVYQVIQNDRFYHYQDLLHLTGYSDYPDAMYRLSKLFKNGVAPDIVIMSKNGYDLAKDYEIFVGNYKGGHGGLHRDLLSVPFILSGPNIQTERISVLRSEDFGRIIKKKLGIIDL